MLHRAVHLGSLGFVVLAAFVGCTATDVGGDASADAGAGDYADLVRAANAADQLPAGAPTDVDGAPLDLDSVRLAAEFDGQLVFLATGDVDGAASVCMVVTDASGSDANGSCEIEGGSVQHAGQTYFLIPNGAGPERLPQDIAVQQLSDNVYVSPGASPTTS
ncbi:hypothetical protein [Pseudoclavibacter helvolus]|uniref:hypothetical protein n=1 Tax=Pseudoclavibacter helvolus TaxID=255205 RepID=UPI003C78410C